MTLSNRRGALHFEDNSDNILPFNKNLGLTAEDFSMSDATSVVTRVAAVLFIHAAGAGVYGFVAHGNLKAAESQLAAVEQERTTLKTELAATEKTVLANSSAVKTCTAEVETYKSRAQTAEAAPEDLKAPKKSKSPRSAL